MSAIPKHFATVAPDSVPCSRLPHAATVPLELALLDRTDPQRDSAEAFVRTIYMKTYGARLDSFYPLLVSITRSDRSYIAVAGVRPASSQVLFSEHYIDQPIDKRLGAERRQIVEVGNLAPASVGQARWLIGTVTALLAGAGFSHVVFTAVPRLKNAFSRMGLPLQQLTSARPENLPDGLAQDWGSYYEHDPAVYCGDIQLGFDAFSRLTATYTELGNMMQQAHTAGAALAKYSASTEV